MAASTTWAGVGKSGSPAPNPMTGSPAAFSALARASTASVADSVMAATRRDRRSWAMAVLPRSDRLRGATRRYPTPDEPLKRVGRFRATNAFRGAPPGMGPWARERDHPPDHDPRRPPSRRRPLRLRPVQGPTRGRRGPGLRGRLLSGNQPPPGTRAAHGQPPAQRA